MHRRVVVCGLFAVFALAAEGQALSATPKPERADELIAALNKVVQFEGLEDPKTTLIDALERLAKKYHVDFEVNERAFKFDMVNEVLKTEVAQPNPIPAMNAPLAAVLRKVLARVPAPSGATFLVRKDTIEITTGEALRQEVSGLNYRGPCLPLVYVRFEEVPLRAALGELAGLTDSNIVLDTDVGRKARAPVTARLRNTPLDLAVRLLADMAGLRAVRAGNVLYVTTPAKADRLQARLNAEALLYALLTAHQSQEAPTFGVELRPPMANLTPVRRPAHNSAVPVFQPAVKASEEAKGPRQSPKK